MQQEKDTHCGRSFNMIQEILKGAYEDEKGNLKYKYCK